MAEETKPTAKFKVGDLVRLRSGGPTMTVGPFRESTDLLLADVVRVWWFSGTEIRHEILSECGLETDGSVSAEEWRGSQAFRSYKGLPPMTDLERKVHSKLSGIEVVPSPRPVPWGDLKRDLDQMARDILSSETPAGIVLAVEHYARMMEELKTVEG